jgi:hypothetical protein
MFPHFANAGFCPICRRTAFVNHARWELGGTQLIALVLGVEFEQARRVRVDCNECLDDVADDVDRFAVAVVAFPRGVSIE